MSIWVPGINRDNVVPRVRPPIAILFLSQQSLTPESELRDRGQVRLNCLEPMGVAVLVTRLCPHYVFWHVLTNLQTEWIGVT